MRVSNRRTDELREGWWNWGGITRPVVLEPIGRVMWDDLGILSDVKCKAGGKDCRPIARTDGWVQSHTGQTGRRPARRRADLAGRRRVATRRQTVPGAQARRAPAGAASRSTSAGPRRCGRPSTRTSTRRAPRSPSATRSRRSTTAASACASSASATAGCTSTATCCSCAAPRSRRTSPAAARRCATQDVDTIVDDLERLGANVTRAQYPLDERILEPARRGGHPRLVQAPVYHEDVALQNARPAAATRSRRSARPCCSARNHPSVLTHSVANELSPIADTMPGTRDFLAARRPADARPRRHRPGRARPARPTRTSRARTSTTRSACSA